MDNEPVIVSTVKEDAEKHEKNDLSRNFIFILPFFSALCFKVLSISGHVPSRRCRAGLKPALRKTDFININQWACSIAPVKYMMESRKNTNA